MKWINIYLIIFTSLFSMLQSFPYAENIVDEKENTLITEEGIPLTPVPEEVMKEVALGFVIGDGIPVEFDTSRCIIIPAYDLKGNLIKYLSIIVYLGEGKTPTVDEILKMTESVDRKYYSSFYTKKELPKSFYKEQQKVYKKISDNFYMISHLFPYYEFPAISLGIGRGLYFDLSLYWSCVVGLENKFPSKKISFKRFVFLKEDIPTYEFEISGEYYYVEMKIDPPVIDNIYSAKEIVNEYSIDNLKEMATDEQISIAKNYWEHIFEYISNIKEKNKE